MSIVINEMLNDEFQFKITHSTQPLYDKPHYAEYGMLSLSEVEEAIYGYSVEKIIDNTDTPDGLDQYSYDKGIEFGFNAHKELVKDKLFTKEDMKKALIHMALLSARHGKDCLDKIDEVIQSFIPTEWECTIDEQGKLLLNQK